MFKYSMVFHHMCYFVVFIIALAISPCSTFTCIHDEVTYFKSTLSTRSVKKYEDIREERDKDPTLFEPLKVYFYLDSFDSSLSTNAIFNVELALRKIRDYVSDTFKVRGRKRPFLLERMGCTQRWQSGENRGKCSKFKGETEVCSAKEIFYMIPDRFLDKLDIYDFEGHKPQFAVPSGPGLLDSNFITFVISQSTSICEETDVFAYGTYCRLDPSTNEPLAGILNLCPTYFSKKIYPAQHYYNILLHELFHILGFSFSLYEKFLPCKKGSVCDMPRNVIKEDTEGIARMMFPRVIKAAQIHFGCHETDFGGPVHMKNPGDNATDPTYTSHWHPLLMYSSIMTPMFNERDHIFVDNITLAVFASTGWYRVNFTKADSFKFGRGQTCQFGVNSTCDNSIYVCDPSTKKTGCDLVHKTIGKCKKLSPYDQCGVYEPYSEEDCESNSEKQFGLDFYSLGYKQMCFMISQNDTVTPSCLPVKCKSETAYNVLVDTEWLACDFSTDIVSTNVSLSCPESFLFCKGARKTTVRNLCPEETSFFVAIRLIFRLPTFKDLQKYHNFKNFKVTTLRAIAERMDIPVNYIVNASLSVFKKIILDFAVCPPSSVDATTLVGIVSRTQKFLDGGNLMHILNAPTDMIISSYDMKIDPNDVISFSDYEGFRTLAAFPFVCGIFLVVTSLASLVRLFLIQKHRPRRALDTQTSVDERMSDA